MDKFSVYINFFPSEAKNLSQYLLKKGIVCSLFTDGNIKGFLTMAD